MGVWSSGLRELFVRALSSRENENRPRHRGDWQDRNRLLLGARQSQSFIMQILWREGHAARTSFSPPMAWLTKINKPLPHAFVRGAEGDSQQAISYCSWRGGSGRWPRWPVIWGAMFEGLEILAPEFENVMFR